MGIIMGATSDGRMFGAKVETSLIRLSLLLAAAWRGGEEETMSYVKPKTFQRPINYRMIYPILPFLGLKTIPQAGVYWTFYLGVLCSMNQKTKWFARHKVGVISIPIPIHSKW